MPSWYLFLLFAVGDPMIESRGLIIKTLFERKRNEISFEKSWK